MTRIGRNLLESGTYDVSIFGIDEIVLVRDIFDRAKLIYLIEKYALTYHIEVYSYNFYKNSVDIMLYDSKGKLSKFMKCVEGTYCQHHYNKKYKRRGTIFRDRFKSKLVETCISNNLIKRVLWGKMPLNDGNLINFDLDHEIVFQMVSTNFGVNLSKFMINEHFEVSENELNIISILVFSLRSFSGYIHKKISGLLKGISESMSSTLSLKGLDLIMNGKFKEFYFKLLMIIYSDGRNSVNL